MDTVLRNGTPIINTQDIETAIRFIRSMESRQDRLSDHSPYTIEKCCS